MAIPLEVLILYLIAEFLAHAFEILSPLKAAGAVSAGPLKSCLDGFYDFLIFVKSYFHARLTNSRV